MLTQGPKGTNDILPVEIHKWQYVERVFNEICCKFGYKEIRLPVFEHTELFQRGVGDTTDIVQKEMYTFLDKGDRSITLKPEGTASVVRSYIEHGMGSLPSPIKLYYNIAAYRYEKMAKGRFREFHQFGVEALGSSSPQIDVEVISLISLFLEQLGITEVKLNINSIGCPECRTAYNKKLAEFLTPKLPHMCETCNTRFNKNTMRILDCKEKSCQHQIEDAPVLLDYICTECATHFDNIKLGLENLGIDYNIDNRIVRGLDYYTKTVFEFISSYVGTQGTVCGGGRYDKLVEECGGIPTPGIGFAMGVERLLMVLESQGLKYSEPNKTDIYIASIGENALKLASKLVYNLRKSGFIAESDLMQRSVKSQMKYADKLGANFSMVLGDDEITNNTAKIKDMASGSQDDVNLNKLEEYLKERC